MWGVDVVEDDDSWWTTLNDHQGKVRTRLG